LQADAGARARAARGEKGEMACWVVCEVAMCVLVRAGPHDGGAADPVVVSISARPSCTPDAQAMAGVGYIARNFGRPGKPAPVYHIIVGALLLGYTLEYGHISMLGPCLVNARARARQPLTQTNRRG
jgi:hypothetical protein